LPGDNTYASTQMGRGRGNDPLPLHPIPKNKTWPFTQKNGHTCCGYSDIRALNEQKTLALK